MNHSRNVCDNCHLVRNKKKLDSHLIPYTKINYSSVNNLNAKNKIIWLQTKKRNQETNNNGKNICNIDNFQDQNKPNNK